MSVFTATLNEGWSFIRTGHSCACPVPQTPCVCRKMFLAFTGGLALVASAIQGAISFVSGTSFGIADAAHGFSDASGDLYGIKITSDVEKAPTHKAEIEKRGSKIIAILLAAATLPIFANVWFGHGPVVALGMMCAGFVGTSVNGLRWYMLVQSYKRSPNRTLNDLIEHAKGDTLHSVYVFSVGSAFKFAELFAINIFFGIELFFDSIWGSYAWSATPENIDTFLSLGVIAYLLYQVQKIWRGKGHSHP